MKTSNKILLGIFIGILLLTTTVNLMVYAKYKRGDYVAFNREEHTYMTSVKLPATKYVSITALGNCDVIISDTPRFEVQKDKTGRVSYSVMNDTLIIHGDTSLSVEQMGQGSRNYNRFKLYIPSAVLVSTSYTGVTIGGAADSLHAPSYNLRLTNDSNLDFRDDQGKGRYFTYFGQVHVESKFSRVAFDDQVVVSDLHLDLDVSTVDSKKAMFNNLSLNMDNFSTITLSGQSIKALKH